MQSLSFSLAKKFGLIFLIFTVFSGIFPMSAYTQDARQQIDSLRSLLPLREGAAKIDLYDEMCPYYKTFEERPEYLEFLNEYTKEARKQGDIRSEAFALELKMFYYQNNNLIEDLNRELPGIIAFYEKNNAWNYYYSALQTKIEVLMFDPDRMDEALHESRLMYDHAVAHDVSNGVNIALLTMAEIYRSQYRFNKAIEIYKEVIARYKPEDSPDQVFSAYQWLIDAYSLEVRYEEGVQARDAWEALLTKLQKEADEKGKKVSSNVVWFELFRNSANLYINMKEKEKAEFYIRKMREVPMMDSELVKNHIRYMQVSYYQKILNDHAGAILILDTLRNGFGERGEIENENIALENIAMLAYHGGLYQRSAESYKELKERTDSLNILSYNQQIDELRTRYEVDKLEAQKARQRMIVFWALTGSILLLIALLIYIVYSRRLKKKNIGLVKQIQEQDRLDKELKEEHARLKKLQGALQGGMEEVEKTRDKEDELFEQLENLMQERHPYTDPSLNRKSLAEMLNTNEKYLRLAINKHLDVTVSEYITLLRLKYAKDLLLLPFEDHTIEAVAIDSGFGSRSTFHSLFRNHYGLTPDEFRKIIRKTS